MSRNKGKDRQPKLKLCLWCYRTVTDFCYCCWVRVP